MCPGYDVTLAFAHIGVPSEWWREAFAVVGAITVGGAAWARMSIVRSPAPREVVLRRSHLSEPNSRSIESADFSSIARERRRSAADHNKWCPVVFSPLRLTIDKGPIPHCLHSKGERFAHADSSLPPPV
jgi:hypothetical protein